MQEGNNKLAIEKLKQATNTDSTYDLAKKNLQAALTNYAIEQENRGNLKDAEAPMKQALDLAGQLYSQDSEKFKTAVENYAGILTKLGRDKEANEVRSGIVNKQ